LHTLTLKDDEVTVRVPTTVLWGERDIALLPGLLDDLPRWVPTCASCACPRHRTGSCTKSPDLRVAALIRELLA
jgi:hypothetical protein